MTDKSVLVADALSGSENTLSVLTWNIESAKKNIFLLKDVLENESVSLAFLSEPQVFQADIISLRGEYCYFLNSSDLHDPELPLISTHATGGTLCLWKRCLDPYITVHKTNNPSFIPIILSLPYHGVSIHVAIYLPTHGKETEFVSDLADLQICIDELVLKYPSAPLFIRGDANVNQKNKRRVSLLVPEILTTRLGMSFSFVQNC